MNRATVEAWPAQRAVDILRQAVIVLRRPDDKVRRRLIDELRTAYREALRREGWRSPKPSPT